MPMPSGEQSARRLAARAIVVTLVILVAMPLYLTLEPAWRPLVARVACAAIVAAGCLRVLRGVRRATETETGSALDALPPPPPPPELDSRFLRLRDELIFSTRRRRYFDVILWPRLLALAGTDLPRPPEQRGVRGRGPSLALLEDLIARIERRA
jgi:hypothetical protein